MKRAVEIFFVAALALVCSTGSSVVKAQQSNGATGEPRLPRAVLPVTSYSFGDIYKGEMISQVYVIRNEGNADLIITDFISNCGCEVVQADRLIPPGKVGTARMEINTANQFGSILKTATLRLNDPNQQEVSLILTANILSSPDGGPVKGVPIRPGKHIGPIFLGPHDMTLVNVAQGQKGRSIFNVTAERGPVKILRVEGGQPQFLTSVETVEESKSYKIMVDVSPDAAPGRYSEQLLVVTDSRALQSFPIYVNAIVRPRQ
jgi:Protein of unknown function (DUF1573)